MSLVSLRSLLIVVRGRRGEEGEEGQAAMEYTELNTLKKEIRLLNLAPKYPASDTPKDLENIEGLQPPPDICCTLRVVSLFDQLQYEALSYVWGERDTGISILVNGKAVQVTKNLHTALRYLQDDDRERVLWIDALCINQFDSQERSHQIGYMRDIYMQAFSVTAWLGEKWEGYERSFEIMRRIAQNPDLHLDPSLEPHFELEGLDLRSEIIQEQLIVFFTQPWWTRVWTVQEYVLAREIKFQCERHRFSSATLRDFVLNTFAHEVKCCVNELSLIEVNKQFGKSVYGYLNRFVYLEMPRQPSFEKNFLSTLFMFQERVSSDPRDKLYGFLGLGSSDDIETAEPDYSLPIETVLENFTTRWIKRTRDLKVFSYLTESRLRIPTFVVDWTANPVNKGMSAIADRRYCLKLYDASGGRNLSITDISPGQISILGFVFDTIKDTFEYAVDKDLLYVDDWLAMMGENLEDNYCNTAQSREMAFYRCLCGDLLGPSEDRDLWTRMGIQDSPQIKKWRDWYHSPGARVDKETYGVAARIRATVVKRRFFITERGYIGFGPRGTIEGDSVGILSGGSTPYIVRRTSSRDYLAGVDDRSVAYSLIGDSYVHGIMDGEAFEDPESLITVHDITII